MARRTTLKDVADRTGFSSATVSRVINQQGKVSEKARKIIFDAVEELGFEVGNNKRLTINKGTQSIGVVVNRLNSPFYSLLAETVERVGREYNRHLMLCSGGYDKAGERDAIRFLLSHGCQHIVLHSKALSNAELKDLCEQYPGITLICRRVQEIPERSVWLESGSGTYLATKHLIKLGHAKIGFINLAYNSDDKQIRFDGYQKAMAEHGLNIDPEWIEEVDWLEDGGRLAARRFIAKGMPVSAIVAFNDIYAASAMREFQSRGIKIPHDVSIIGFDNIMEQCYFHPSLTTLKNPIVEMAERAARICLSDPRLKGLKEHIFYPTLIHRDSVAGPNSA